MSALFSCISMSGNDVGQINQATASFNHAWLNTRLPCEGRHFSFSFESS